MEVTAEGRDDEGFQTVTSKRKKKILVDPPQIPQNLPQAHLADCITVYFHAILSKDFRLDPKNDLIFMVPGQPLGDWSWKYGAKMEVTKDLGQHGCLVQGHLVASIVSVSVPVPYKYVVYKATADGYENHFEYIYKTGANGVVNRCLPVLILLTQQGEWHQYDDIIHAEPEGGMVTRFRSFLGLKDRRDIAQGRQLAGQVMLGTIFNLLRGWSAVNVTKFFIQLRQFFVVYSTSLIFEDMPTVWESLGFGQAQVQGLLKEFLLKNFVPVAQKDGGGGEPFLRDPLKAGLITMLVWREHLELTGTEQLSVLCGLLCLPQKPREELCVYWRDLASGFQDPQGPWLVNTLELFCGLASKAKLVKWILVLPLLHLLRGDCRPFDQIPASPPAATRGPKAWAGLGDISLSDGQPDSEYTRALLEVMAAHTHLVEVDRLLTRSWLFLLGVEAMEEFCSSFPVDLHDILQRLSIQAKFKPEAVQQLLLFLSKSIKEQKFGCHDGSYGKTCLAVSLKLLERICQAPTEQRSHKLPTACVELVFAVAEFTACFPAEHSELSCGASEELGEVLHTMRGWMRKTFNGRLLRTDNQCTFTSRHEREAWNNILSLSCGGEEFTTHWRTTLLNDFEGKLKQERSMDQIEIYCNQNEEMNRKFPTLSTCLEKCALEAVTSVCKDKKESSLFEQLRCHDLRKFGKLVSALVLKAWPCAASGACQEGEEAVLEHLLTWSAAKKIFQLQGADGKLNDQLTDVARERMSVATSVFSTVSNEFLRGNIGMRNLNRILQKKDRFLELLDIDGLTVSETCRNSAAVKRLLRFRQDEVTRINHQRELLSNLLQVCRNLQEHVSVDVEELESRLGVIVEEKRLDEFLEVHQPDTIPSETAGAVACFDLPRGLREMAEALHMFRDSLIFKRCWESEAWGLSAGDAGAGETGAAPVTRASLAVIHHAVFQPCYRRYRDIHDNLRSGGLTLQEVDDVFEDYKDKYDELTEDLQIMRKIQPSENNRWIHQRVQQIEQYHELQLALESAKVIMEVKQTLHLQGDFHIVDTLLGATDADFKKKTLDCINNDLIKLKKEVAMTTEQRLCLQEICLRRNFIVWVKEALQDLSEVKVFMDLASISAGENDLDVDRVACFHDTMLGYSSVLYELKPDAGFRAFKKALEKLFKALKNDNSLPNKLRDTARYLEWLKTVKESHGSVEFSSLSLASDINSKGLYIVRAQSQKKLTLDTTLKLEIVEETQQEVQGVSSYSLEDLRELLNKLMLMSGRGEQGQRGEVDRFSEVFSSVQRMALAFIDLHAAGNPCSSTGRLKSAADQTARPASSWTST
ncbi:hypothetical protein COCON_G00020380 [Conger conger]|uniref:E3 ubiquitin-protein ligase RNF213 n=1 Tax=Conger conger TaxID=82655 RepID=A0A9Q1DWQ3_CONCO|nr:hypothetical protein COCON_G00020380 [Conger conger]